MILLVQRYGVFQYTVAIKYQSQDLSEPQLQHQLVGEGEARLGRAASMNSANFC
jgi:hypothetical protein